MNAEIGTILTHILVVIVAAKLAAEVAERIGVPAVVGEIVAGIIIGPSMLGLVGNGEEVLHTLGELGVILLLLDVGLEMDLGELRAVGRASLLTATVGVIAPLALGLVAMEATGTEFEVALFVAAALTATSVGITARVFGDLRALATTEARVVLGAAVADDVIGLVVLTVVVRIVTDGSVSPLSVTGIVVVAVGFLVAGCVVGLRLAPPLFSTVERYSRSTGTVVALALAFTLAFAQLADTARLAPIVGAFVAGLALNRSRSADRIRRELAPVGHLFIPVFFLQIGIDAEIAAFARADVLRDAGLLLAVAVVGKLVSPLGAIGSPGDKVLIGLGMLPRGEVGLIFATIGLQTGVLDEDLYASLLLVVLATTLMSPPLLRWRLERLRRDARSVSTDKVALTPAVGWITVRDGEIVLTAEPADHRSLEVALEAAVEAARARPSQRLLDWLTTVPPAAMRWDDSASNAFLRLLQRGNARSWRFLDTTGVLTQAMPELADSLRARHADPFWLDLASVHGWGLVERLQTLDEDDPLFLEVQRLDRPEWLLLGALLTEVLGGGEEAISDAELVVRRLDLGPTAEDEIATLVRHRELFWSMARRPDGLTEASVLQLASHLARPEVARALYVLSVAADMGRDRWEVALVEELHRLVQEALAHSDLTGLDARNLAGRRRVEAITAVGEGTDDIARIDQAPTAYVLSQRATAIARHARLLTPLPERGTVRVAVSPVDGRSGAWAVDIAARDTRGLLAAVTGAIADVGYAVQHAAVATWPDGGALEAFVLTSSVPPNAGRIRAGVETALDAPLTSSPLPDAGVVFSDDASPWHTICEVRVPDTTGVLHALATGFTAAAVQVHAARIATDGEWAVDRFELTGRRGGKLDDATKNTIRAYIAGGVATRRRRLRVPVARVARPELLMSID